MFHDYTVTNKSIGDNLKKERTYILRSNIVGGKDDTRKNKKKK